MVVTVPLSAAFPQYLPQWREAVPTAVAGNSVKKWSKSSLHVL